jgi:hypothetical protein
VAGVVVVVVVGVVLVVRFGVVLLVVVLFLLFGTELLSTEVAAEVEVVLGVEVEVEVGKYSLRYSLSRAR